MSLIATGVILSRAQEEHGKAAVAAVLHPVSPTICFINEVVRSFISILSIDTKNSFYSSWTGC
jgi:hypothetical protein